MNCYNQQFTGMPDYGAQMRQSMAAPMAAWQNQPTEAEMSAWQSQMMPDMDCGMPPAAILPAGTVNRQKGGMMQPAMGQMPMNQMPANQMPVGFAAKMDSGMFPIAMAYVPMQRWSQPSQLCEGFRRGTMFRELDLPFVMGRCQ